MIYNTRGRNNDTTETQKERRPVLMLVLEESDCPIYSKQTNKVTSLKSLVMLKCES